MTVAELIIKLQMIEQSLPVYVFDDMRIFPLGEIAVGSHTEYWDSPDEQPIVVLHGE